ncbi:MAG: Loki-CTERM sorting domain-containing protein [Candidatus Hodarchaeota archaeon]
MNRLKESNATPEVPGYPLLMILISLGIGIVLVYNRLRKKR